MQLNSIASALWFGTEESYFAVLDAVEQLHALEAKGVDALKAAVIARGGGGEDNPFGLPPLLQVEDGTGVIAVEGPLIAGSAGFMRLFGVIGYDDIKGAVADAMGNKDVKRVLLSIESGGGHVAGLESTGEFIMQADKIKPIVAHTDGMMASAAYWLGISARKTYASKTAVVGSVGTAMIHVERSKQLAKDGVTPTIIRFGEFKMLNNPIEPLSDKGRAQMQALVDDSGKVFVDFAAQRRGVSAEDFQKTMGEGRVFPGRAAADVGLTDGVMSMEQVHAHLKTLDTSSSSNHNPRNSHKGAHMKVAFLAKKTVLAIAAGTALDSLGLDAPEANTEGVKLEADALAAIQAEAKEVKVAFDGAISTAVTAATTELSTKLATAEAKITEVTTKAATDLKAVSDDLVIAKAAASDLKGKLDVSAALGAKSAEIVKQSINVMSVALGGAADVAASLTGDALLAEHERLEGEFKKKFPSGAVAAVTAKAEPTQAAAIPATFRHLVNSNLAK